MSCVMKIFPKTELKRAYELLSSSFNADELGSFEQLESYYQDPRYKIFSYEDETAGALLGLHVIWEETEFVFGAYLVVKPEARNAKLGRVMIQDVLRYCDTVRKLFIAEVEPLAAPFSRQRIDFTRKTRVRMNPADYLKELTEYIGLLDSADRPEIFEVDHPESIIPERRIGYYLDFGLKLNAYEYVQPALEKNTAPVSLNIMSYPRELTAREFENFRAIIYREMYKVP